MSNFLNQIEEKIRAAKQAEVEQAVTEGLKSVALADLDEREGEVSRLQEELSQKRSSLTEDRAAFEQRFQAATPEEAPEVG